MSKILIVCNYDFAFNKYMIPLANRLLQLGHEVGVACDGESYNLDEINGEIKFHQILMPRKISPKFFISSVISLRKIIIKNEYQVVNSNNRNASFIARLTLMTIFSRDVKSVYTARGMYFHDSQRLIPFWLTYWIEIFLLFFTDLVMSQSQEDVDKLNKNFLVNSSKIKTIDNGINLERFSKENVKNPQINLNGFVVSTIGRIVKEKGLIDLLNAFSVFSKKNSNSSLLIIGGTLHEEHEAVLENFWKVAFELGIKEKIYITGMIDNVEDYLFLSDVYVHPSYREGVPRSILEAMALEKIVIATKIRGANEIINNKDEGYLYTKGNVTELAMTLNEVFLLNEDQKQSKGHHARQRILSKYTEEMYLDNQINSLNKILK
jgi:glycosyltransferase involved in cell wall biosynthesis